MEKKFNLFFLYVEKILVFTFAIFLFASANLNAQTQVEKIEITNKTNVSVLKEFSKLYSQTAKREKNEAIRMAKINNWIISKKLDNGQFIEIQKVRNGKPVYYITKNINAAKTISTNNLWSGGSLDLDLNGTGMIGGVWDGGGVLTSHQEFEGRVTQQDSPSGTSDHGTHVAGTMVAAGVVSNAKGMAHEANLDAYDWNSDDSEMSVAAANGLLVSNHSYGIPAGYTYTESGPYNGYEWYGNESISDQEDYLFGFYTYACSTWDNISFNAPYYQIVVAAGNDRGEGAYATGADYPVDGGDDGFDCISDKAVAKNVLTVANVIDISGGYSQSSDVQANSSSSFGPADDGRIKPDIAGNGTGLYSSIDTGDDDYASYTGTSMASPNVSGSLILLQQHYNNLYGKFLMAASLKALVLHTADEAGPNDGPDYMYGWGLMNTSTAANVISSKDVSAYILEDTINNNESYSFHVYSEGTDELKVTVVWTDPAGSPVSAQLDPTDPMLVNDLDLRITKDAVTYFPWKLDVANPANAAIKADNSVDNVECVDIKNPDAGLYTVNISHKGTLTNGNQKFSVIVTGIKASAPGNFMASAVSSEQINLEWSKNVDNDDVMIVYTTDSVFGNPINGTEYNVGDNISGGGIVLCNGQNTSYNHLELNAITKYHYKAWSVDGSNIYSTGVVASATTLKDIIFADDFENDKNWILNGEFERDAPLGLGGEHGNADPDIAFEGNNVLGSDLTGMGSFPGDYESNLSSREYIAESPLIDCGNYSEVELNFMRWLNVEDPSDDKVYIDISNDNGDTWTQIWTNNEEITDNSWLNQSIDISAFADDNAEIKIRFAVGSTGGGYLFSGWNIDDFKIVGVIEKFNVEFNITDGTNPIDNALIEFNDKEKNSDSNGNVTFYNVKVGDNLNYIIHKPGFSNYEGSLNVVDQNITKNVTMNGGTAEYRVTFYVTDSENAPIENANVDFNSTIIQTNDSGYAIFDNVSVSNDIPYVINKGVNYGETTGTVDVVDENINKNLILLGAKYDITFDITEIDGLSLIEADVTFNGFTSTATDGTITFTDVEYKLNKPYIIEAVGYNTINNTVDVDADKTISKSMEVSTYDISFNITENDGVTAIQADVIFDSDTVTASGGIAEFTSVPYELNKVYTIASDGFETIVDSVDVVTNKSIDINMAVSVYDVNFTVTDGNSSIQGVDINIDGASQITNNDGLCSFSLEIGNYDYLATVNGYSNYNGSFSIEDSNVNVDIVMEKTTYQISFTVKDKINQDPIVNASVMFVHDTVLTDSDGIAMFPKVEPGTAMPFIITKDGFKDAEGILNVTNADINLNIKMELGVGIKTLSNYGISIYPNPSDGIFNIRNNRNLKNVNLEIRDLSGRVIIKKIINSNIEHIDISNYSKGIYIINMNFEGEIVNKKIVIK